MKPGEFLGHFHTVENTPHQDQPTGDASVDKRVASIHIALDYMLSRVGTDDPANPKSEISQFADEVMEAEKRLNANGVESGQATTSGGDTSHEEPELDPQNTDNETALEDRVEIALNVQRANICYATLLTLAKAVQLSGKVKKPETIPAQAIGSTQRDMAQASRVIASTQFEVEKDFIDNYRLGIPKVAFSTSAYRVLPEWMKNTEEWTDGPIDQMLGFCLEHDGLYLLREWCKARQLGYIPVFAPLNIDRGQFENSRNEANLQSDILLVRLGDEPDILPFQIKTFVRKIDHENYDPRVVLMSAHDMGLVTIQNPTVRDRSGNMRTGRRVKITAGSIARAWNLIYANPRNQKQKLQQFGRRLKPQITRVDKLIEGSSNT